VCRPDSIHDTDEEGKGHVFYARHADGHECTQREVECAMCLKIVKQCIKSSAPGTQNGDLAFTDHMNCIRVLEYLRTTYGYIPDITHPPRYLHRGQEALFEWSSELLRPARAA